MTHEQLTVLAVGSHPDDLELFCGGTLAKMAADGDEVIMVDLTRGEMGTHGTPPERNLEAEKAAVILGAQKRENLDLGDASLEVTLANRHKVAGVFRKYRPDIVFSPFWEDRHPDHAAAGGIVRAADFDARLARLDLDHPPHAVGMIAYYPCHQSMGLSFIVDITDYFETKMRAIRAFRSQFGPGAGKNSVSPIGLDDYLWHIESRVRYFGGLANCRYAEGFICQGPLKIRHPGILIDREGRLE